MQAQWLRFVRLLQRFATVGGLPQQLTTLRYGLRQSVGAAMLTGLVFVFEQGVDMGRNLNLLPFIKTPRMGGKDLLPIEDAYFLQTGHHCQGALYIVMRH